MNMLRASEVPDQYRYPYIDTCVFLSVVIQEPGKWEISQNVLTNIENKMFKGVICPYTYAECHKDRTGKATYQDIEALVIDHLNNDAIFDLIQVSRSIGIKANELCRTYGVHPVDAIHLACALYAGCDRLLTWDSNLIKKANLPDLIVEEPRIIGQSAAVLRKRFIETHCRSSSQTFSGSERRTEV